MYTISILSVKMWMPTTIETISLTKANSVISFYMNVHRFSLEVEQMNKKK